MFIEECVTYRTQSLGWHVAELDITIRFAFIFQGVLKNVPDISMKNSEEYITNSDIFHKVSWEHGNSLPGNSGSPLKRRSRWSQIAAGQMRVGGELNRFSVAVSLLQHAEFMWIRVNSIALVDSILPLLITQGISQFETRSLVFGFIIIL